MRVETLVQSLKKKLNKTRMTWMMKPMTAATSRVRRP